MIATLTKTYREFLQEFPTKFWILVGATFIDQLGSTLAYPFFALYITQKFNVGMTETGLLFAIFSICGLCGSMIGGALTDKFGRKGIVLFGLIFSALSSLAMGAVNDLTVFYLIAIFVGLLSNIGSPARQAMIADILPEEQRSEGFSIFRVVANLAWIIGPTIGGFVANTSYFSLFVLDCILSLITAAIVAKTIPETKPEATEEQSQQTILDTLIGYRIVAKDKLYLLFIAASILMLTVYRQLYSTVAVFLRDVHNIPAQGYGFMISLNAGMVVLLQFWFAKQTKKYAPHLVMALGTFFFLIGFTMYGLGSTFAYFIVAIIIITLGEMLVIPVGQTIVTKFAPTDMRGRYMAFYSLAWTIPSAVGPWAAGLIMDNFNPNWVWYACGFVSVFAIAGFYTLHLKTEPHKTRKRGGKTKRFSRHVSIRHDIGYTDDIAMHLQ